MKKKLIIVVSLIFLSLNIPVTANAASNIGTTSITKTVLSKAAVKVGDTIKVASNTNSTELGQVNNPSNVTFDSNGGLEVASSSVEYNGKAAVPIDITRTGYTFAGWYTDNSTFANLFDFTNTKVTEDITLFAKWTINSYAIAFNSQGGSVVSDKSIEYNNVITEPTAPTKTGYTFGGWYKEEGCLNAWNFITDKVTSDTMLYAKWVVVAPPSIPTNFKATILSYASIKLTWSTVVGASGYEVYRATSSTGTYSLLTKTSYLDYTNSGLITGKKYYYKVRAYKIIGNINVCSKWTTVVSGATANIVFNSLVQPNPVYGKYAGLKVEIKDENNNTFLIRKPNGSQVWVARSKVSVPSNPATNTKYLNKNQLETYVNITSTFVSNTKYFTWVDLNRQRVNIFTGGAKHWTLVKTYSCATGNNITPSKRGLFTIQDKGASFVAGPGTIVKYWTRYSGNFMLHSIILTTSGAVCDATIGKRVSHGCIRMPLDMAKWYYEKVPKGSLIWVN